LPNESVTDPSADKPTGQPPIPRWPRFFSAERRRPRGLHSSQPIAYLYLAPAFAFFIAFALVPLAQTVNLSFYEWNGITDRTWIGFENYATVLTDPKIREALGHSIVLIGFYAALPITIALIIVGLMVRVRVRGQSWFRAVLFVPTILPLTVVAVSWRWIYAPNGPLNRALDLVGLDNVSRAWLGDFTFALPALGLIGTWVTFGLVFVLFLAGVQKIPIELYEAAKIDGANIFREFLHVTLPGLRGEITIALVLTVTAALRNFDVVFVTTRGGPGTTTEVPSVFIFRSVFQTREVGLGAAIGVVLMIELLIVNVAILWYRRRGVVTS
jgi:raffinose/stachyose/melibiose transport system permease protein